MPVSAHPAESAVAQVTGHRVSIDQIRFCRLTGGGAAFVGCLHASAGHSQWRNGRGTPGHTWPRYQREARQLRRWITALARPDCSGPSDCPALIREAFRRQGIGWRGDEAVSVATCESSLVPTATNGSHDGLFQQSRTYWSGRASTYGFAGASAYDPWANAMVSAGMVRDTGGWSHWSCQP